MAEYVRTTSSATTHFSRRSQSTFNGEHVIGWLAALCYRNWQSFPDALELGRKSSLTCTSLPWSTGDLDDHLRTQPDVWRTMPRGAATPIWNPRKSRVAAATPCDIEESLFGASNCFYDLLFEVEKARLSRSRNGSAGNSRGIDANVGRSLCRKRPRATNELNLAQKS